MIVKTVISFGMLCAFIVVAAFLVAEFIVWQSKKNAEDERKHKFMYDYLLGIMELPVNETNYQLLKSGIDSLKRCEETNVLEANFYRKYESYLLTSIN